MSTSKSERASAPAHSEFEQPSKPSSGKLPLPGSTAAFPPNAASRAGSRLCPLAYRIRAADAKAGKASAKAPKRASDSVNFSSRERLDAMVLSSPQVPCRPLAGGETTGVVRRLSSPATGSSYGGAGALTGPTLRGMGDAGTASGSPRSGDLITPPDVFEKARTHDRVEQLEAAKAGDLLPYFRILQSQAGPA